MLSVVQVVCNSTVLATEHLLDLPEDAGQMNVFLEGALALQNRAGVCDQ